MTTNEWMNYIYGLERRDDSNRCRTGRYFHVNLHVTCHGWRMIERFQTTSEYGPGLGEPYTMKQIAAEVSRIRRRLKQDPNAPYELVKRERDAWALIPVRRKP